MGQVHTKARISRVLPSRRLIQHLPVFTSQSPTPTCGSIAFVVALVPAIFQPNRSSIQLRKASAGYYAFVLAPSSGAMSVNQLATFANHSFLVLQVSVFRLFIVLFFITLNTHRAHVTFFFFPGVPHRVGAFNTMGFFWVIFLGLLGQGETLADI